MAEMAQEETPDLASRLYKPVESSELDLLLRAGLLELFSKLRSKAGRDFLSGEFHPEENEDHVLYGRPLVKLMRYNHVSNWGNATRNVSQDTLLFMTVREGRFAVNGAGIFVPDDHVWTSPGFLISEGIAIRAGFDRKEYEQKNVRIATQYLGPM